MSGGDTERKVKIERVMLQNEGFISSRLFQRQLNIKEQKARRTNPESLAGKTH